MPTGGTGGGGSDQLVPLEKAKPGDWVKYGKNGRAQVVSRLNKPGSPEQVGMRRMVGDKLSKNPIFYNVGS